MKLNLAARIWLFGSALGGERCWEAADAVGWELAGHWAGQEDTVRVATSVRSLVQIILCP